VCGDALGLCDGAVRDRACVAAFAASPARICCGESNGSGRALTRSADADERRRRHAPVSWTAEGAWEALSARWPRELRRRVRVVFCCWWGFLVLRVLWICGALVEV